MGVELPLDEGGVDMRRVFDGDFDGVEAPLLELLEELLLLVELLELELDKLELLLEDELDPV